MNLFEETGLMPEVLKAVAELGFKHPTPIQEKAIPVLLDTNSNLLGLAQTGTGKTAAFGLPIVQLVDSQNRKVQSIILCPTRELCRQIATDLESFSKYLGGLDIVSVYGGANIQRQIDQLRRGCQIVVGTPGRVIGLIKRGNLKLGSVAYLVLDEADEMLNMGFKEDLDTILAETPDEKQTFLFSATMPADVSRIAEEYMKDAVEISAGKRNMSAENIEHIYYLVEHRKRYKVLKRIADINPDIYGIVFCRTRRETQEVADHLIKDGYNADAIHGDLSQAQRDQVMQRFRTKQLQLLVATDVAARGLDVDDITHIINYNLPDDLDVYIHRSGRTARAGKKGISIALIGPQDKNKLRFVEKQVGKKFKQELIPTGKDICTEQLFKLIDKVHNVEVNSSEIEVFLPEVYEKLQDLERDELIKRFVSIEFNRFLSYYRNAEDLNVRSTRSTSDRRTKRDADGHKRSPKANYDRFFISLGSKDSLNAQRLMGLLNEQEQLEGAHIGRIEILKKFSFFEIDQSVSKHVVGALEGKNYRGAHVFVESAKSSFEDAPRRQKKKKKKRR